VANARVSLSRLIAGYGVVVCAAPYLVLKIVWLAGGQLGVADPVMMRDRSMIAANAVTAGMDVIGIVIALAFTHRWGLRIPGWFLLPPIWVATGLLVRFVAGLPLAMIAAVVTPASSVRAAGGPVHPWVYALVYTGFAGMGIGLVAAFLLYVRTRWDFVFRLRTGEAPRGATHDVQVPLATTAALMAVATGTLHLAWAFGATVGFPADQVAERTIVSPLINALDGILMISAAAGVLAMVHRVRSSVPLWAPLVPAWVGSGSLFAWGLWHLINVLGDTALVRGRAGTMPLLNLLALVQLLAGLIIGVVTLVALAERAAARSE
jgi:hypothetical protein